MTNIPINPSPYLKKLYQSLILIFPECLFSVTTFIGLIIGSKFLSVVSSSSRESSIFIESSKWIFLVGEFQSSVLNIDLRGAHFTSSSSFTSTLFLIRLYNQMKIYSSSSQTFVTSLKLYDTIFNINNLFNCFQELDLMCNKNSSFVF